MATERKITVSITDETVEALRDVAERFGFVSTVGRMANQGNISGLLDAIGRHEIRLIRSAPGQMVQLQESAPAAAPLAPIVAAMTRAQASPRSGPGRPSLDDDIADLKLMSDAADAMLAVAHTYANVCREAYERRLAAREIERG